MASNTLRSPPKVAGEEEAFKRAQKAARPRWKTSYKGPDPNRQKIDGKMVVSREELADFRKRFGANKTLRDLLNADRTGKLPPPVNAGRGVAEGRKAEDKDTAPLRASRGPAAPYRDKAAEAKREADTSALLERMKSRQPIESNEAARDRYKANTLNALTALGTVAGGPLASRLGAALARRGMKETPALTEEVVRQGRDIPFKKGGVTRGDGCAQRGKTRGRVF